MKKLMITTVVALAIHACAPPQTASKTLGLQGVWNRIGTINYEDGKPKDTVLFDVKSKQLKFYTTENFMFVANGEWLDYMSFGTDNYLKWIEGGDKTYRVKISLSENHYTQYGLDSLGKGMGELYKRVE
jgi:hypothetical protein